MRVERLDTRARGMVAGTPVPRVLPGEEVALGGDRPRILQPSDHRVSAPCRHYKSCGGCALQHGSDAFVADWKTDVIAQGLKARGLEPDIRPIQTSPPGTRRRAVLHGRRTKAGAQLGFMAAQSGLLTDTPECLLLDPRLMAARPALLDVITQICSRKGQVDLAVTVTNAGLDLEVRTDHPPQDADRILPALAETHDFARVSLNQEVLAQRRPPTLDFAGTQIAPPPGAFLQATPQGEAALQEAVAEAIGQPKRVVDLFSGCGTFTFPTLRHTATHAVESEPALLDALEHGWRHAEGLRALTVERRDLFRRPLLPDELKRVDAVIIDPPRAGAEAQVIELAKAQVARIAAVSCNPVTFARDARLLVDGGYRLDWVQPIDQFRWSSHTELAAQFTRV